MDQVQILNGKLEVLHRKLGEVAAQRIDSPEIWGINDEINTLEQQIRNIAAAQKHRREMEEHDREMAELDRMAEREKHLKLALERRLQVLDVLFPAIASAGKALEEFNAATDEILKFGDGDILMQAGSNNLCGPLIMCALKAAGFSEIVRRNAGAENHDRVDVLELLRQRHLGVIQRLKKTEST